MTRIFTTLLASTMLVSAPALAATDSADSGKSGNNICENAFNWGDADQNAKLTRAEVENMRDEDYGAIDANSDGEISKQEYVDCLGKSEKLIRQEAAAGQDDGTYNMADWSNLADDDQSELSAEEWADKAQSAWEDGDAKMQDAMSYGGSESASSEEFARAATARFRMHDENGDGIITASEYETDVSETRFDESAVEARFEELDADNSGGISPQEYRGAGVWAAQPAGLKSSGGSNADTDGETASGGSASADVDVDGENKTSVAADGLSDGTESSDMNGGSGSADSEINEDTDAPANEDQAANEMKDDTYTVPVYHYYIRIL
ncbi:MAG: EF-hand domain-containing protein [Marinovum algicola]|uniref:EF-hand domain-containing protein n=1 Tax=Marinovum algicola TaxID=42444 RepID=UPI0032ED56EA